MSPAIARDISAVRARWMANPAHFTTVSDWVHLISNLHRSVRSNKNRALFRSEDPKHLRDGLLRIAAAAISAIECLDKATGATS